jgi:hypothetical protein
MTAHQQEHDPSWILFDLAAQHRRRAAELERDGYRMWLRSLDRQLQKIWDGESAPRAAQFDKPPAAYE